MLLWTSLPGHLWFCSQRCVPADCFLCASSSYQCLNGPSLQRCLRHSPPGGYCCSGLHRCRFRVVFPLSQALRWPLEALVSLCIRHLHSCVIPTGIWNSAHRKLKPASSPSHPFRCPLSLRWRSPSSLRLWGVFVDMSSCLMFCICSITKSSLFSLLHFSSLSFSVSSVSFAQGRPSALLPVLLRRTPFLQAGPPPSEQHTDPFTLRKRV